MVLETPMRYPQPSNEDEFEEFGLALLRCHWKCEGVERYGHRGERQHGVDIIDLSGAEPLRAAQCKHHAPTKTLPPSELREEVLKARAFNPPLGYYLVLTSAKKSTEAQNEVLRLNIEHRTKGLFQIELMTWEDIERLIGQYPDLQARLMPQMGLAAQWQNEAVIQRISAGVLQAIRDQTGPTAPDERDAEIDEAKALVEQSEFQCARLLLNRIRERHWDKLTDRQRFRVAANTASALMGDTRFAEAGRHLIEAADQQPDDTSAQAFRAVGLEMLEDAPAAYELAGKILAQLPTSTMAAAVRIRTAPAEVRVAELRSETRLADDAEVSVALAMRCLRAKNFDQGLAFATSATQMNPDWPAGWLLLGQVHLAREIEKLENGTTPDQAFCRRAVQDAERHFTTAIEKAKGQQRSHPVLLDAIVNRSKARDILKAGAGTGDLEEAYRLAPQDPEVLFKYALLQDARGNREEAIRLARDASTAQFPNAKMLLGIMLCRSSVPGSRAEGAQLFRDIASDPNDSQHVEAAINAVRVFCADKSWSEAEALVRDIPATAKDSISSVLKGIIENSRGNSEAARQAAIEAAESLSTTTPHTIVRATAELLVSLGMIAESLPLWKRLYVPGYETTDARHLLAYAERLERFDLVLEVCRSFREGGDVSRDIFELEASVLERIDPPQAVQVLQEHLAKTPDDQNARLRLSIIGLRIQSPNLVACSDTDVPRVEEVQPSLIPYVVHVLRGGGRPEAALVYAYRALRRHYASVEAHRTYLQLLGPGRSPGINPTQPELVAAGTAVSFLEAGEANPTWRIVEDDVDCYDALVELRPDSQLAGRLLGKRVGDQVVLAESDIARRTAQIIEIVDKHVYRYRDVIQGWQLRFPEHPDVQMVRLPETQTEAGPQLDLDPVLKLVDMRAMRAANIRQLYKERAIPVHLVAAGLDSTVFAVTLGLAEDPELEIRVATPRSQEDLEATFSSLRTGSALVVDSTAIATVVALQAEAVLPKLVPQVELPVAVNDDTIRAAKELSKDPGTGVFQKGPEGPVFRQTTVEETQAVQQLEERLIEFKRHTKLVGCPALAFLPPDRRNELQRMFGESGAQTVMCATVPGHVLWTDDFVQAFLARHWFGVASLSTELVLRYLASSGQLDADVYRLACAKLVGWRYVPTPVDGRVLFEAARATEWNAEKFPLKAVLELLGCDKFPSEGAGRITCQALPLLFKEIALPETRSALLAAVLDQIANRQDWEALTDRIHQSLPLAFGANLTGRGEAQEAIRAWQNQQRRST
jgi:tetratricopeptide (TPR) repeat protein